MVVEDNALNFELVGDILEVNGFDVLHATTGEEGLRLAREHLPAMIIMDLSLPGMDGLAATRALRADPETMHLIIIALTAHAMRGDQDVALAAGCDGYLTKPIETSTFASRIEWFITAGQAFNKNLCKLTYSMHPKQRPALNLLRARDMSSWWMTKSKIERCYAIHWTRAAMK